MARPDPGARLGDLARFRAPVLAHPLARGLDPREVAGFLETLPSRRYPRTAYASRGPGPCLQPRGGFPRFDSQLSLTRALDAAGADFIPLTIDSYTRQNQYETAAQLLQRSEEEERDYLNGYPLVCHGHELSRELYRGIDKPISLRHGTPDARLLIEIAIATGIVEIEGGGICYCLPYSEGFPLDRSLLYWQYVDRVCASYSTPERPVHRESFGPLSATLVPPAIAVCIQIIEALLAAEQGVTSFAVSFGQTGSVVQDIATARSLRRLTRHYLDDCGFGDTRDYLVYHQWMGQFPHGRSKAAALISCSALVANLVGADKIVVKTVDEALGVPTADINAEAVDTVAYLMRTFQSAGDITSPLIEREMSLIESEVHTLLGRIFETSGDMFWESVFRAFQAGWIDVPFSPHADNANKLISMRDANGSIRIKKPGNVPLTADELAMERQLLAGRDDAVDKTWRQLLADINIMM